MQGPPVFGTTQPAQLNRHNSTDTTPPTQVRQPQSLRPRFQCNLAHVTHAHESDGMDAPMVESGTTMMAGVFKVPSCHPISRRAAVWMVFPRPISSPKMHDWPARSLASIQLTPAKHPQHHDVFLQLPPSVWLWLCTLHQNMFTYLPKCLNLRLCT